MNSKISRNLKFVFIGTGFVALIVFGFFSNEARKEIKYLCGNFDKGDSLSNVTRQLNTINLSQYRVANLGAGKQITHSSWLHLNLLSCEIEFNPQNVVVSASYGQT
ncbi:hypothetical protein [Parashewanella tropica]|uniref:hypothetical protein n=1 Tax=Parashewanella tropica TaxID=2547970 RepID=UPI00105A0875|nr:hypothetical protein [Parashewanella tropica]